MLTPQQLRLWRERVGFERQDDAAKALGLTVQTYGRYERSSREVDRRTALAILALELIETDAVSAALEKIKQDKPAMAGMTEELLRTIQADLTKG